MVKRKTGNMVIVKNPSPGVNFMLLLAAAGIGYGVYRHRKQAAAALRRAREVAEDVRLPMPHFAVVIPSTQEEHEMVDDAICACRQQLGAPQQFEANVMWQSLTLCVADMLYPDFPWPPQVGDHESIPRFWDVVSFRIRSLIFNEQLAALCAGESVAWEDLPPQPPQIEPGEGEPPLPGVPQEGPTPPGAVRYYREGYAIQVEQLPTQPPTFEFVVWAPGVDVFPGNEFHREGPFPTTDHAAVTANAFVDAHRSAALQI